MNEFLVFDFSQLARLCGHRGAAGSAPENTLAAIRKAAGFRLPFVEFDINLAAHNEIVLFHDFQLDRCTDGSGLLTDHSYAQLRKLDAGSHFSSEFAGEKIPRFVEAIELLAELNMGANVEVKSAQGNEEVTVLALASIIRQCWPQQLPILISSFNERVMDLLSQHLADISRGFLVGQVPPDWRAKLHRFGAVSFHCKDSSLQKHQVQDAIDAGYRVLAYTVNSRSRAELLLEWGVSSVISDHPQRMMDLL